MMRACGPDFSAAAAGVTFQFENLNGKVWRVRVELAYLTARKREKVSSPYVLKLMIAR